MVAATSLPVKLSISEAKADLKAWCSCMTCFVGWQVCSDRDAETLFVVATKVVEFPGMALEDMSGKGGFGVVLSRNLSTAKIMIAQSNGAAQSERALNDLGTMFRFR